MTPDDIAAALSTYKPLRSLIKRVGPPPIRRAEKVDRRFDAVARAIVYQQLAGKAAAAIHGRVQALVGNVATPEGVLALSDEDAASCGLSRAKRDALRDLAIAAGDGRVDFAAHGRRADEHVIAELVTVRGVGPWTAQMYLMSTLARHDVWPALDYGVRNGWSLLHGIDPMISVKDVASAADHLRPHRSAVAWYCWRAIDELRDREG